MKTVPKSKAPRGFALVVTLTLMILLTVIAVGLLTLSSISLRSTGHGASMAQARANARLALALAIGELQRTAGLDTRVTAPANLVDPKAPQGIAGVWKSWRPERESPNYTAAKTNDNFLGYLMSNTNPGAQPVPGELPTGKGTPIPLVGPGSVGTGNKDAEIGAPLVGILNSAKKQLGGISWVALDEGVKSRIDLEPAKPATSLGQTLTQAGSPARNGFEGVNDMDFLVASSDAQRNALSDVLPKLVSLDGANLAAGKAGAIDPYFHDFNVDSESVQANVADGGLKTDLSVLFDAPNLPTDYASRRLYSGENAPLGGGRSPDPMWALYQSYAEMYRQTTANNNPMDGFQATAGPRFRLLAQRNQSPTPGQRYEPDMSTVRDPILMPTVARVDIVFSLVVRDVHSGRAADLKAKGYPYMVHLMYLPVSRCTIRSTPRCASRGLRSNFPTCRWASSFSSTAGPPPTACGRSTSSTPAKRME